MTVARQTLHNLMWNHGVENDELLDALHWKFAKLVDEQDALRAERNRLREEVDRLREILRLTQTYEKYASAALAKEAGE